MRETLRSSRLTTQSEPEPAAISLGTGADGDRPDDPVRAGIDRCHRIALDRHRARRPALAEREDRDRDCRRGDTDRRRARIHAPTPAPQFDIERAQLPEVALQADDDQLVEVLRVVDVLQTTLAQVADRDPRRKIFLRQLARGRREQNLTAVPRSGDPRRPVNADADVPLLADSRLTGVQAHPDPDRRPFGPALGGQVTLSIDGGRHCVCGGGKGDEERVTLCVHHLPSVGGDRSPHDPIVDLENLGVPVVTQRLEQRGRPLDVREQEGDGPAWEFGQAPATSRRRFLGPAPSLLFDDPNPAVIRRGSTPCSIPLTRGAIRQMTDISSDRRHEWVGRITRQPTEKACTRPYRLLSKSQHRSDASVQAVIVDLRETPRASASHRAGERGGQLALARTLASMKNRRSATSPARKVGCASFPE